MVELNTRQRREHKASRITATGRPDRRFGPRPLRPAKPLSSTFTAREREVTVMIATGTNNDEIAAKLGVSTRSVNNARTRAIRRLGCEGLGLRGDVLLTRYALREGWVSL